MPGPRRPRRRSRALPAVLVALLLALGLTSGAAALPAPADVVGTPGALTSGDSLFPGQGNGGYDVQHYAIALTWAPRTKAITATTTLTAVAGHDLSSFGLDLEGLTVHDVVVDGRPATFRRSGTKLVVTPVAALLQGATFTTTVRYSGHPVVHHDPDGSPDGWMPAGDGVVALSEPVGAMTWFPDNDTPADKATYSLAVTVPAGLQVVSNGRLQRRTSNNGCARHRCPRAAARPAGARVRGGRAATWHYVEDQPMASYLALVAIGHYRVHPGRAGRVRLLSFSDKQVPAPTVALRRLPGILSWLQDQFGPFPFPDAGIVRTKSAAGYALETQTRPTFTSGIDETTEVHELAHQYFGDAVSLRDWSDIWLNEGFATYSEWLWAARSGKTVEGQLADKLAQHPAGDTWWRNAPDAVHDPAALFADPVYTRGAMTLEALRETIGAPAFTTLLHRWSSEHRGGNVTTADFVSLAEQVCGRDLGTFFDQWLVQPHRPTGW